MKSAVCTKCRAEQPRADHSWCRKCNAKRSAACKARRAEKLGPTGLRQLNRRQALVARARKFGLSLESMLRLLEKRQCDICGTKDPGRWDFSIDHCHRTGRVRGLLCVHCNTAIGRLNDDPELLRRAIRYLETTPHTEAAA